MQQMTIVGIILVALVALGLGVIFVIHTSPVGETPPVAQTMLATSTVAEETDTYVIDVAYPQFGIPAADAAVKGIVDKAVVDFKAVPPYTEAGFPKYELDGSYDSAYIGPDVVSAKLLLYQDTGGAHGIPTAYGLNFDATGAPITLDAALALTGKTLQQVSDAANAQLVADFDAVQFPEGATPTAENYSTFVIGKDSVTFIFQPYQVEAYAAGMPEVRFPRVK